MSPWELDVNAASAPSAAAWAAYEAVLETLGTTADPLARARLDAQARVDVGAALNVAVAAITFASGGTEAAARGLWSLLARAQPGAPAHLVVSQVEHAAVAQTLRLWQAQAHGAGLEVTALPAGRDGQVSVDAVAGALRPHTVGISLTYACNETGVLQPIAEVAALCRSRGLGLHTDAVQAIGRVPVDFAALGALGVTALSLSGHKIGAVGGTGVLLGEPAGRPFMLPDAAADNLAGAVALGVAMTNVPRRLREVAALRAHRDAFEAALLRRLHDVECLGGRAPRLCNTSCMRFAGCSGAGLMMALDLCGIAVSTGSACSSGSVTPSPILLGMGLSPLEARQALRFSFGDTHAEIAALVDRIVEVVGRERALRATAGDDLS